MGLQRAALSGLAGQYKVDKLFTGLQRPVRQVYGRQGDPGVRAGPARLGACRVRIDAIGLATRRAKWVDGSKGGRGFGEGGLKLQGGQGPRRTSE